MSLIDILSEERPRTVGAAVRALLAALSPEEIIALRETPEDELIDHHFGLGRVIREAFGLYRDNPALIEDSGATHPDDASLVIIKALWQRLRLH